MSIYTEGKAFGWDRPLKEEERKDIETLLQYHNPHGSVHRALMRLLCAEKAANELNEARARVIESYMRIEKDLEDDCKLYRDVVKRLKAEIERLKAENVRVVAAADAGYEKLVHVLRWYASDGREIGLSDWELARNTLKELGLWRS
ncbi:hypothetical protein QO009_003018 [Brevibacillus aydinogluensis]|uniref:hypothetical protein n=1 Tax=Brevibacillus aydinogluensis TaxID=927786 RepID=UPI002892FEFB|nr:hypothetical protein [Brevibacillus aydinogluensis]MDT3417123.1 hypothetical protein [Brevibacillus aydinogluensis]